MKNVTPKHLILALGSLVLVVAIGAGIRWGLKEPEKTQEQTSPTKVEIPNQIPIEARPFIMMTPRSDGREVTLTINRLGNASSVEYELEYQAGSLLQGAFGKIDFTSETSPVSRNILFGSCSAGGKCTYHEDVNGGTLLLRYQNGEPVALKSEWNLGVMREQKGRFVSRDAKFSLAVGERGLPPNTFVIVTQTMGLPKPVDGEILAGPYAVSLPQGVRIQSQELSLRLRLTESREDVRLLAWKDAGWNEYETEISGKELQAAVDLPTTFVAVSVAENE